MAGKKVFLCYALGDQSRVAPLLAACDAWAVTATQLNPAKQPPGQLLPETVRDIRASEVYLRLCTGATRGSPQVALADAAYRSLVDEDRRKGKANRRRLVNLILDKNYVPDQQDKATLYIDTANKTRARWLEELAIPLGVATLKQRISRRALVGMGVGLGLAVVSTGSAVAIYAQQQEQQRAAQRIIPNTAGLSGQARWTIPLGAFSNQSAPTTLFDDDGMYYATVSGLTTVGVYSVSLPAKASHLIPVALSSTDSINTQDMSAAGGLIFLGYTDANQVFNASAFHATDGALAFHIDCINFSHPLADNTNIYCLVASSSGSVSVSALHKQTGAVVWRRPLVINSFDVAQLGVSNILAVGAGAVFVSDFDHRLTCYDAATGQKKWRFLARGVVAAPAIVNGVAYAGARDGSLYALDAATGGVHWRTSIAEGISASPLINDGALYIGSLDGYLYAFDIRTGALFWRVALGNPATNTSVYTITAPPAVYHNVIAVASLDSLFAFDLRDGSPRWHYAPVPGSEDPIDRPQTYQGLFVFGSPDGKIYAVNP